MTRILSIGEAMVELSGAGQPDLWRAGIAGDTLNTAWYLRRLLGADWQVGYLTRGGTGPFSDRAVGFMATEGLDVTHIARDSAREIGLYAITLADGERSFSYWRDSSAARRLADDPAVLARALEGCALAYLSGITLAILPPEGRGHLMDALAEARAQGTQVVFDPTRITYSDLLKAFWENHDPTQGMRQGNDLGTQYRSAIYTLNDAQQAEAEASRDAYQAALSAAGRGVITTAIEPAGPYYFAEDYHQGYLAKNPAGYCGIGGTGVVCPIGLGVGA